ncbi:thiamine diphosphokinase [Bacteroidetes bacterium endosymbiont of Geopemphigus sp.]|uniref:thiamine diphosphokinase n=1 Tax=Bacteroidetes bacterium endosymbiont of Geopemphigus sp. TaxID=2047937 RepID=UPI000CD1F8EA|nr:thiamine diphosphokinase [Bacteroidetes bacterium endosymbiont of Geopemphigus sp.]
MDHLYKYSKIALFINGEPPLIFPKERDYEKIFATDGAYRYLKETGISPDVVNGDWDSLETVNFPKGVQFIHTPDQNSTDFEKALQIIDEKGFKNVDVWGASGREQDHFLGNLSVGLKYSQKLSLRFYDNYYCYFFAEKLTILPKVKGKMISLFPFPETKGIDTKGLKYPLQGENLSLKGCISTRNKAIKDQVKISYKSGSLLLFVER